MAGKLREHTDFKHDSVVYGPIGEIRLKEILTEKGHRWEDVSSNPDFHVFDVDILQYVTEDSDLAKVLEAYRSNKSTVVAGAVSYEVKTDTFGIVSRNIVWEDISNSNPGCMARTKADYLFYVFIDKNKEIVEEFLIEVKKLRRWLLKNFGDLNKVEYLKSKSMQRGEDNTAIFLINVDKLVEEKIARKL